MKVSAWYGGTKTSPTFGIRVGVENRDAYFDRTWEEIVVEIDSEPHAFRLTPGFWRKCPEFRDRGDPIIKDWLQQNKSLKWARGNPPKAELQILRGNKFRLLP